MSPINEVLAYARKQRARFKVNLERALATGDVEAVHDVRVASRRLHEFLKLMNKTPLAADAETVQKTLKKVRKTFRRVRDLDVFQASLAQPGSGPLSGGDLTQLEITLTSRRSRDLDKAAARCRKIKADRLVQKIQKLSTEWARINSEKVASVAQRLGGIVDRRLAELLASDPRGAESTDLHVTRIRLKRFRYAAELLYRLQDRPDDELIQELASMQDMLGHWNDRLAAASRVSRIARRTENLAMQTAWSGRLFAYAATCLEAAEEDRRQIVESWPRLQAAAERIAAGEPCYAQGPRPGEPPHSDVGDEDHAFAASH